MTILIIPFDYSTRANLLKSIRERIHISAQIIIYIHIRYIVNLFMENLKRLTSDIQKTRNLF